MTTSPADEQPGGEQPEGEEPGTPVATIIGTGLIGGSVGLALKGLGWRIHGVDADRGVEARAQELGVIDEVGLHPGSSLVVVATPVGTTPTVIRDLLEGSDLSPRCVITDVGSVKETLVARFDDPRVIGGHPMAGSEQVGVDGARADLFVGATWVLCPTSSTDPAAYAWLRALLGQIGAQVVDLAPARHDAMVAAVSHVPHLTAAALMGMAADLEEEHAALLQLAAGGFRDMTRIAAGRPTIWPDICLDNQAAILATLDTLIDALGAMRSKIASGDQAGLLSVLERAAGARRALNERATRPEALAEVRVPVTDQVGVVTNILVRVSQLGINIEDLEIAHSVEGDRGVLVLTVDRDSADRLVDTLTADGLRASVLPLGPWS